ncbi:hypothetical protein E2C01_079162 [Portunus trituberculatus]|uniref:Uncharacterized protein n=1 Tax=Portunus trituberculatus TaxID=210409 RepID=A0A5B7IW51_PORTR|nr:hypothetical protein [Portunus trituberculatus]
MKREEGGGTGNLIDERRRKGGKTFFPSLSLLEWVFFFVSFLLLSSLSRSAPAPPQPARSPAPPLSGPPR